MPAHTAQQGGRQGKRFPADECPQGMAGKGFGDAGKLEHDSSALTGGRAAVVLLDDAHRIVLAPRGERVARAVAIEMVSLIREQRDDEEDEKIALLLMH